MLAMSAVFGITSAWKGALLDAVLVSAYTGTGVLSGMGLELIRADPTAAIWASTIAFALAFLSSIAAYRNVQLPAPPGGTP